MKNLTAGNVRAPSWSPLRTAARAWERFWFTPADPTLLGLIRICCGAITLYTIVAYTFTLQEVIGKDAWVNHAFREDIRHNNPLVTPSLDWDTAVVHPLPPPETEEQRQYAEAYKQKWGAYPPPPYPRTDEEDRFYESYRLRWGFDLRPMPAPQTAEQKEYVDSYTRRWGAAPPPPYPRDAKEAEAFNEYRERWGVDPRLLHGSGSPSWSLWFHVTDPVQMAVLHGCICVIVFLFTIGLCTRLTSVLTWAAALWYIHRSPPTLFGVDTMMTILLLYLMIGPSGAALSADRWLARWWAQARPRVLARWRAFWHRGNTTAALPQAVLLGPPEPSVSANFAIRLLQIHVCIIYLAAGLSKLQGVAWWNGTAVWGTLANFEFAPMQYASYMTPLRLLAGNRVVWEVFMTSAGIFTLFFEIAYVFMVWHRSTRWLILSMAIVLHGFIGLFMGLKTFSLIMLVMNMAFLNPETVRLLLHPFARGNRAGAADWPEPHLSLEPALANSFHPDSLHAPVARGSVKRKNA